ncbi:hypothetical protein [Nonomuraea dietziae]|uniref:hypothetical protein n=1 Tax=Nonomuraea dietziae TaxID=65515 RepID=UPI003440A173
MSSVQTISRSSSDSAIEQDGLELREMCRVALEQFNGWLQATVPKAPHLVGVIPMITQAIHLYRAGQHEACISRVQDGAEILQLVGYPVPMNQ